ncbi:MAG: sterol desaturase family protein [Sphingomonas sp.]|nr:sterol desaturase family protein [Sphingomonas sp.]
MPLITGLLLLVGAVAFMEGFAYVSHRWVMHGRLGWVLHASHHRARAGRFELNDLYGVIFASPSILLIYQGVQGDWGPWAAWVGAGIAAYGAIYLGFHDVIVHRRIEHRLVPRSAYFKRIVQAHRIHHIVESRLGAVSFGFLYAPPVETLKVELGGREGAQVREPRGVSTGPRG